MRCSATFPKTTTRALGLFIAIVVVASALSTRQASAATADPAPRSVEFEFVAQLNAERTKRGLAPLVIDAGMTAAARDWAETMARGDSLAHADDISTGAPAGWRLAGENVGRGFDVDGLVDAFMDSPSHRENILEATFDAIGVGVAYGTDGRLYTTHRFVDAPVRRPRCHGRAATIIAVPGVVTVGTSGADVIVGTAGPDEIRGRGGNDLICGRGGDDTIRGGRGSDRIFGGSGVDHLSGNRGRDVVVGGAGFDVCPASAADVQRSCGR